MARYPGFIGPTYTTQSKIAADDRTVNWYPSKVESGTGTASWVFDPTPGYRHQKNVTTVDVGSSCRGLLTANNVTWVVLEDEVHQLASTLAGASTNIFTVSNASEALVSMATNGDGGNQLMVASDGILYCHTINPVAVQVTEITTIGGHFVAFQDGYFIALDTNTSSIHLSALEDGTSWDPLDVAQRSDSPDKWISMLTRPKELWLFGQESTSVYYNDGTSEFPYVPNPSVAIPYGTAAARSPSLLNGSPCWLSSDLVVRYANGYTPQRISTHAVEWAIRQMTTVSDAESLAYTQDGHLFYQLNFPTEGQTWTYDLTSGMWHERGSWDGLTFGLEPARCCTFAYGFNLVGLYGDIDSLPAQLGGHLYEYTPEVAIAPNAGDETAVDIGIRRLRRAPHLIQEHVRIAYPRFELYMEVGLGAVSGNGSDPQMYLRWSDDGGQSFGNMHAAGAGAIGQFKKRVIWRLLGQSRDRVFEVSSAEPIPLRLIDAFLDTRGGAS